MARWHELRQRIDALEEIGQILTAMRNLAFSEVRRLADGESRRRESLAAIEIAVSDLAAHFPGALPARVPSADITVALGSERGLCGDFNDATASALDATGGRPGDRCLAVGAKLVQMLEERGIAHGPLAGPSVPEEVPQALTAMVAGVEAVARGLGTGAFGLILLHHDGEGVVRSRRVLPFPELPAAPSWQGRPDLQLAPRRLYESLVEHYVFCTLSVALLASLLAENRRRLHQLGLALDRLHERLDELRRRRRRARQEAITEEIEVILMGGEPAPGAS